MSSPVSHTCCFCGDKLTSYGHNPEPYFDGPNRPRCCDACNRDIVSKTRAILWNPNYLFDEDIKNDFMKIILSISVSSAAKALDRLNRMSGVEQNLKDFVKINRGLLEKKETPRNEEKIIVDKTPIKEEYTCCFCNASFEGKGYSVSPLTFNNIDSPVCCDDCNQRITIPVREFIALGLINEAQYNQLTYGIVNSEQDNRIKAAQILALGNGAFTDAIFNDALSYLKELPARFFTIKTASEPLVVKVGANYNYIYKGGFWTIDSEGIVRNHMMGIDETKPKGSPDRYNNMTIKNKMTEITKEEALKMTGGIDEGDEIKVKGKSKLFLKLFSKK